VSPEGYGAPIDIVFIGLCPSNTPTQTQTPTPTPTPVTPTPTPTSVTPTPTPTPSVTPNVIYTYNLRTGGYYQNVCEQVNFGNVAIATIYCTKPFESLVPGDYVFGNREFTIPPINANFTLSNGAKVTYKKTDFKNDEILLEAVSFGGTNLYSNEEIKKTQFAFA
jgi:hypothetical protein